MPSQSDFDSDNQLGSELQRILHSCVTGIHATVASLKKTVLSSDQHQAIHKLEYDADHLHSILPLLLNTLNDSKPVDDSQTPSPHNHLADTYNPMPLEDELEATQEIFGAGFAELAQLFLEDSPPRLLALRAAALAADCKAVAQNAHTLCGSTSSIGATSLAAMCRELELRARNNVCEDASQHVITIDTEYTRIERKLRGMF